MKEMIKRWLRSYGITRSHANIPQYWIPYTFMNGKAFTPQTITIEATLRCNLSCQMCPLDLPRIMHDQSNPEFVAERKKAEMTTEEILGLIDDVANMGVREMTLTGGEFFLRRDALELIERVKARGLRLCVNTNAWFLTRSHVRRLIQIGVDALSVSIDGPDEVHDEIRRGKGSFRRICDGLARLKEEKETLGKKKPSVGITVTIFALNQGCFSEVIDAVHNLGVASVDFDYMFFTEEKASRMTEKMIPLPVVRKEENQILPMELRNVDADIMYAEVQRAKVKAEQYGVRIGFGPPFKTKEEIHKRFHDINHANVDKCFYPWKSSRVNPYGDVYSCSIDVAFGNIREAPFSQIWNGEAYRIFRQTLKYQRLFPKCTKCCALNNDLWGRLPAIGGKRPPVIRQTKDIQASLTLPASPAQEQDQG